MIKLNAPSNYQPISGQISSGGGQIVFSNDNGVQLTANSVISSNELSVSSVPEPSTYLLMLLGLVGVSVVACRKST